MRISGTVRTLALRLQPITYSLLHYCHSFIVHHEKIYPSFENKYLSISEAYGSANVFMSLSSLRDLSRWAGGCSGEALRDSGGKKRLVAVRD